MFHYTIMQNREKQKNHTLYFWMFDFDAEVADTKQHSFSLFQLIKTNPALTPSCFPLKDYCC